MGIHPELIKLTVVVPQSFDRLRLDLVLSNLLPKYSRALIQLWIRSGAVTVDGKLLKQKEQVRAGQTINLVAEIKVVTHLAPQALPLDLIYEDNDLLIINKPTGLVTHPGAGNFAGTLLNALIYHYPELTKLPRGGIVHRLDKDTSGIMVISRNLSSYHTLVSSLQARKVRREYEAVVTGKLIAGGTITAPIGRHPLKRTQMAVRANGKLAVTHYRVVQQFNFYTKLRVILDTGRTHQIRVHLAHLGYPIVGDQTYGKVTNLSGRLALELRQKLANFKRQALHARFLSLVHPATGKLIEFEADPPEDFNELLKILISYDMIIA
jgi:23S rRNA pseudouridine1911/1915/1917 synthase